MEKFSSIFISRSENIKCYEEYKPIQNNPRFELIVIE